MQWTPPGLTNAARTLDDGDDRQPGGVTMSRLSSPSVVSEAQPGAHSVAIGGAAAEAGGRAACCGNHAAGEMVAHASGSSRANCSREAVPSQAGLLFRGPESDPPTSASEHLRRA